MVATGGLIFALVLLLMALGVPVAFAFLGANLVGAIVLMGSWEGLLQMVDNCTSLITSFTLVAVPMFVLMGALLFHSGLARRVFDTLDTMLGRVPARLSYLTVAGGATFSTLTGSTMANTAMLGSLMVPEMNRRGYAPHMSIGPIVGTGGLAMLIPPSALGVMLGSLARIDIGALLIAGLLPGLLLALLYCLVIWIQVRINPDAAPAYNSEAVDTAHKLYLFAVNILPLGLVIFCVVGFILLGIATPSESASFGALSVVVLAALNRCLTLATLKKSLESTVAVTAMVFLLVIGSSVFGQLMAFSGSSTAVIDWAISIEGGELLKLVLMFATLLLLGMFMDQISMLLLTIPIFFPLAAALGYDAVWFGIIVLLALEMSLTTPPFGLLLFLMQGVAPSGTTLSQVAFAALPYLACDLMLMVLLILFPGLALFLPGFI
ncbi:MAG: C4-dicarboxylate ABC transporter permease [Chromatiales bacterium]|jgi:tripartite ATP-independent transporter DctM subunit|nr:C4-dicarboxylate ABC transporter permease [Chromatiales bacterium]MDP6149891.1 TRAP transporter large permease [Gammaproteobacteria bacterium]MDP7271378.1 TRAP transporter large permease [Gammaproteobacteria bacterium]HJP05133.1 TRAP transporter large permease [Gammaproteobacteria bacterium]